MSKLTITFDEDDHGQLVVFCDPSIPELIKSGGPKCTAEGLACVAWDAIVKELAKMSEHGVVKVNAAGEVH